MTIPTNRAQLVAEIVAAMSRFEGTERPWYDDIAAHPWREAFVDNNLSWKVNELLGEPGDGAINAQRGQEIYRAAWIEAIAWFIGDLENIEHFWHSHAYEEAHLEDSRIDAVHAHLPPSERL